MNEISPWRIRPTPPQEYSHHQYARVSEPDEVSLSTYWHILVKNRKTILAVFFLVLAVGSYFALSATPLYTAVVTIKIEPQNPRVTGGLGEFQSLDAGRGEKDDYSGTQFALLKSRPLAARVITELALGSNKTFTQAEVVSPNPIAHIQAWFSRILGVFTSVLKPIFQSRGKSDDAQALNSYANSGKLGLELSVDQGLIDQYLGFITVTGVPTTRLGRIEVATPNPTLSQVLANTHVETFMRMNLESRFGLTQEAREFLEQKKNELRQKLEKSEAELNKFRRANNVLSVDKGENIVVDRLVDLNKQLTGARAQRIDAESLNRTVENKNYQDLAEVMRQGLVQQLKNNVANLEAEKARIGTVFKPDHPRILELNQQITAARQAFNNEIDNVVRSIKSNYAAALARERGLESEVARQQQDALSLRELGVQYTVLQEDVNANRSLYESVLKRLSETNVSNDLAISNMQIVERAARPLRPSAPSAALYVLGSMLCGLFLGVGFAFLREFITTNVGTPDDVTRATGLATLGIVPHAKFLEKRSASNPIRLALGQPSRKALPNDVATADINLIVNQNPLSMLTECYRSIRTSLLLTQAEKPPQVILLTSPSPQEGKTTTSLNLGIALAQDNRSVLLIDGDMRKGLCHARLGMRNHRGLSNVLTGTLTLEDGVRPTPVDGLSLLSCGVTPPNPTELLGSRKMAEVLQELRQRFEFIVIDSPPIIGISDAAILSILADGVLLVFNGAKTSTAYAQKAVERLDMVRARLIGVVLNGVNLDDPHYGYYQSYSTYYKSPSETESSSRAEEVAQNADSRMARLSHALESAISSIRTENLEETSPHTTPEDSRTEKSAGDAEFASINENRPQTTPLEISQANEPKKLATERTQSVGIVPSEFMERFINMFADSMGPIAPLVIRDHIAELGESVNAFPKSRLPELVRVIIPEIFDAHLRSQFQSKVTEEIRTLENE
jgi:capsular exopolysaccharide synthesis family protein